MLYRLNARGANVSNGLNPHFGVVLPGYEPPYPVPILGEVELDLAVRAFVEGQLALQATLIEAEVLRVEVDVDGTIEVVVEVDVPIEAAAADAAAIEAVVEEPDPIVADYLMT